MTSEEADRSPRAEEVRIMQEDLAACRRLLTTVRQLCETDGVNPTVRAIAKVIDNG